MPSAPHRVLTISVDDGHPTDLRCAELLRKYGLRATFYVPQSNPEREVIADHQIRELAREFEVGAHSLRHLPLPGMSADQIWNEVHGSKTWLEDVMGRPADSFCYPRGKFNRLAVEAVRRAGYMGARTCFQNCVTDPADACLTGASTQAYSHSRMIQIRHALIEGNVRGAIQFITIFRGAVDWETHFTYALKQVEAAGGVAHLYFHGWEIDQLGAWNKLERVLQSTTFFPTLQRMSNGEYFRKLRTTQDSTN